MALLTGGNIVNVERVVITTEAQEPRTFTFQTSSQATFTPAVSQGQEKEQRIKNTLMGLIKTEDLSKGYDIELTDQRLLMDVFALIDGGTVTGTGEEWTRYTAPVTGSAVSRVAFTLDLYTSDRGTDGAALAYYKWSFPHCKGSPVTAGATDDDFYSLQYTINSRPATGTAPMTIEKVQALPVVA